METILKNELIKVSVDKCGAFTDYYVSIIGKSRVGKFEHNLITVRFNTIEEAVQHAAKQFAKYASQENCIFTLEELQEEYYSQLINNDCNSLYEYLIETDYFKGYKRLEVTNKTTLKELKEWAKKCRIQGFSKYNNDNKDDLVKEINNYNLAISL